MGERIYKDTVECPFCDCAYIVNYGEKKGIIESIEPMNQEDKCQHYQHITRGSPAVKFKNTEFVSFVEYQGEV